jgi:hypothetical protein
MSDGLARIGGRVFERGMSVTITAVGVTPCGGDVVTRGEDVSARVRALVLDLAGGAA